ncbi:MAG TPA: cyanase [Pseudonocardiaceae bacterium]|nr:cyanase [Pseudonocardiaceae bacterium]
MAIFARYGALMVTKQEAGQAVVAAKTRLGLTWAALAEAIDAPLTWTTSALLGQHPLSADQAATIAALLELSDAEAAALAVIPTRGALDAPVPTDPTIYRFYEVLQVYGPAIKELIHEKFGDGIMSAINFRIDVERRDDPGGERVVVTLDGKFLKYQWG